MRMRVLFFILALTCFYSSQAQTGIPVGSLNFSTWRPFPGNSGFSDSGQSNHKWQLSTYSSVSAGAMFYNGTSATFLSAPIGLQVTRQLSNNVYAFGTVSVAPAFVSFSRSFTDPYLNTSYPGNHLANPYALGVNAALQMGLMYVNDAKTFSISGSIGIERSSSPYYYPTQSRVIKKQ